MTSESDRLNRIADANRRREMSPFDAEIMGAVDATVAACRAEIAALRAGLDAAVASLEEFGNARDAALARVEAIEVALRDIVACEDLCHLCAAQAIRALASPAAPKEEAP